MGWTHNQNERRGITEESSDEETRRLQKARMTISKMGVET